MKFYTVEEVSEITRFSQYYVRKLLRENKIIGNKLGKSWRVSEEELQKYLKGE